MLILHWFTQLSQWWAVYGSSLVATDRPGSESNVAASLLQSANALAGLDPHEAQRLRSAARAYLSVIR